MTSMAFEAFLDFFKIEVSSRSAGAFGFGPTVPISGPCLPRRRVVVIAKPEVTPRRDESGALFSVVCRL